MFRRPAGVCENAQETEASEAPHGQRPQRRGAPGGSPRRRSSLRGRAPAAPMEPPRCLLAGRAPVPVRRPRRLVGAQVKEGAALLAANGDACPPPRERPRTQGGPGSPRATRSRSCSRRGCPRWRRSHRAVDRGARVGGARRIHCGLAGAGGERHARGEQAHRDDRSTPRGAGAHRADATIADEGAVRVVLVRAWDTARPWRLPGASGACRGASPANPDE